MSLKSTILYKIKSQGECSFEELYAIAEEMSHRPDNVSRRARELTNEGLIIPLKTKTKDGVEYISGYRNA